MGVLRVVPMIEKSAIANPKTHYGSGKAATRSFFLQRLTGAFNIAFTLFFVWFVVSLAGADRGHMVEMVRNPGIAIVLALLIINVCIHMRIGMREVIEDYIDDERLNHMALTANTAFAAIVALLTILSIAKIVFWG
jgi:succinate dehydrogenase / fumarate reductase, membrane anchor subunit